MPSVSSKQLSGILGAVQNEGLSLSRSKTRLMSASEFRRSSPVADPAVAESETEEETRRFLKIRLAYDPYSTNADADYVNLAEKIKQFDVLGMLAREFEKSRVDQLLVRKLVQSTQFLAPDVRDRAVESIVQNIDVLYPVFPTVAIVVKKLLEEIDPDVAQRVFSVFRALVRDKSYILEVQTNLAYAVRVLAYDPSPEAEALLDGVYEASSAKMIRRDVILAMGRRPAPHWVSEAKLKFLDLSRWEQRAIVMVSYVLGEEGKFWRKGVLRKQLVDADAAFKVWAASRAEHSDWSIPL